MSETNVFDGAEYIDSGVVEAESGETPEPSNDGRGFANPETLAKAQETRRRNKADNAPVDAPNEATPGAKRGRKPGVTKIKRDLSGIIVPLVGIHMMLASVTGYPDLAIDDSEATTLATALSNLTEYYKVKIDGKTGAILGLLYAIAVVYGPRIYTILHAIREEKDKSNGGTHAS